MPTLDHTPFQMYGGKWEIASWIVEHLPPGQTLVLTHGGSGSPLWHIEPGTYPVEVYNDLWQEVFRFFNVCREEPEALAAVLLLTPYSRFEYGMCKVGVDIADEDLESARRFAVVARQSMSGEWGRAWSRVIAHSRRGMSSSVSRWLHLPETVLQVAARLSTVQIECQDALECIRQYDRPKTVFYLDPPYHPDTRIVGVYQHEYTHLDHVALLEVLQDIKGKAVLSGYHCELYDTELTEARGWRTVEKFVACRSSNQSSGPKLRTEVLWIKGA